MMEAKIMENPCSPASQSPEYLLTTNAAGIFCPVENPPISHLYALNQDLESALSRLTLAPENRSLPLPPPPFHSYLSAAVDLFPPCESPFHQIAFEENQHSAYWGLGGGAAAGTAPFLASSSSGNQRSSYCFPAQSGIAADGAFGWAHQKINVGPEGMWATETTPYLHVVDDRDRLMNVHQRQDFDSADFDYSTTILHGKEQISRNTIPILPFAQQQQGNFGYINPHLPNCQQKLTPEIMRGRIVTLAKDQRWSNALDLTLEEGLSEQEIDKFLPEVLEYSGDLMRNQFGSQFVLKLFASCSEHQKNSFIFSLINYPSNFIDICLNSNGAKAIQKLLEKLTTPQQISLMVSSLVPGAFALSTDPNGQHVIQQCVKKFSSENSCKKLVIEIANSCYQIGTNKSGCCVIQLCVEHSSGEARKLLISEIIANAVHLAEDPYGNYVVQHLLGLKFPEATADLMIQFRGRFVSLSCNKFASNVVEKFLVTAGDNYSTMIILELLQNAPTLFLDPYGNFVVQKALAVSKAPVFGILEKVIMENAPSMQSNIYGKKILEWFQKNTYA
ncbi:hypothetical protein ACS0TY_025371 [Phlomoides rotata]